MLSPLEEQLRRKGPRGEMNPYKCNGRQKQAALCCSAPPYEKESVIILAQQAVLGNLASIKKENERYQRIGDPFLNWCGLPPFGSSALGFGLAIYWKETNSFKFTCQIGLYQM